MTNLERLNALLESQQIDEMDIHVSTVHTGPDAEGEFETFVAGEEITVLLILRSKERRRYFQVVNQP